MIVANGAHPDDRHRLLPQAQSLNIQSRKVVIDSPSGLRPGTLSVNFSSPSDVGIVLCPGLAVGLEGAFIRHFEDSAFRAGAASRVLRFNFSGHEKDDLNTDLTGFTFTKAVADFIAAVGLLRAEGAKKVIAVGSSTGVQPALLASCGDTPVVDAIVGRASVVDCFQSIVQNIPPQQIAKWKSASQFPFPVGGRVVQLSGELLKDIELWDLKSLLPRLTTQASFAHGTHDKTARLEVLEKTLALAPQGLITIQKIEGAEHELPFEASSEPHQWMMERCSV
jgi:hypothetical protein